MRTKVVTVPAELKAGGEGGTVEAAFSVYRDGAGEPVIDSAGDVTLPSAFVDQQPVAMVWSHQWDKIIGKGVVRTERDRAVFAGEFFATALAQECRETIKGLGPLAQWSFGYEVLEAEHAKVRGEAVQILKRVRLHEVSPVLVGANPETSTLAIKQGAAPPAMDRGELRRIAADLAVYRRKAFLREVGLPERRRPTTPYDAPVGVRDLSPAQTLWREVRPAELVPAAKHRAAQALAAALGRRLDLATPLRVRWFEQAFADRPGAVTWLEDPDDAGWPVDFTGQVFGPRPTDLWVRTDREGRSLAHTIAHEVRHAAQYLKGEPADEAAAERFAEVQLGAFGLDYFGAWPAEWAEVVA